MSKVVVATFQHKHGSDVQVFASAELAETWRQEVAADNWSNGTDEAMPSDPRAAADRYFAIGESIGDEFFSTAEAEIQGAGPLHAAAPDMLAALKRCEPWMGRLIAEGAHKGCAMPRDAEIAMRLVSEAIAKAGGGTPEPARDVVRPLISALREYIGESQKLGFGDSSLEEMALTAIRNAEGKL